MGVVAKLTSLCFCKDYYYVTNTVIALASQCQPVEQSWSVCIFLGHGVPLEQTPHCFGCLGPMLTMRTGLPLGSSWPRKKQCKKRQGAGGPFVTWLLSLLHSILNGMK